MRTQLTCVLVLAALSLAFGRAQPLAEPAELIGLDASAVIEEFGVPVEITAGSSGGLSIWRWAGGHANVLYLMDERVVAARDGAAAAYTRFERPALGAAAPEEGTYLGQPVHELARRHGSFTACATGPCSVELVYPGGLRATVAGGRVIAIER